MTYAGEPPDDSAGLLERLKARYLADVAAGKGQNRRALLDQHPDLADRLREFFFALDFAEAVTSTQEPDTSVGEAQTEVAPADLGQVPTPESSGGPRTNADPSANLRFGAGTKVHYLGDYELLQEIGRGGMGIVYRARQKSLDREVALKMMRAGVLAGADARERFQRETRAVAALEHPNIVSIIEVGEHEGNAYYTMNLVKNGSLSSNLSRFTSDPRLAAQLIKTAAEAVSHAHKTGILHRDIKPGNILIDENGQPHLSDFGLAKWLDEEGGLTHTGQVLGTIQFISPEQADGKKLITVAIDVYGLGAVLYAILTGQEPFHGDTYASTLLKVKHETPPRPSKLNPKVDRDLETVCMKCLEKDPARRYSTAQALADDLGRWLNHEPIEARPVSTPTRAALWARRNPVAAALAAGLLLAMTLGTAGVTWLWREAEARGRALGESNARLRVSNRKVEHNRAIAERVNEFFTKYVLRQAHPAVTDRERKLTVEEALDRASEKLDDPFTDDPMIEAAVRMAIADCYRGLGHADRAAKHAELAWKLKREALGGGDLETLTAAENYVTTLLEANVIGESGPLARMVLRERLRRNGEDAPETFHALFTLGMWQKLAGQLSDAEASLREAAEGLRASGPDHEAEALAAEAMLAEVLLKAGRVDDAETALRQVAEDRSRLFGVDHPQTLTALNNLAACLLQGEKFREAESLLLQALEVSRRVVGPGHEGTVAILNNLSVLLLNRGDAEKAETYLREAIQAVKDRPDTDPTAFAVLNSYAILLLKMSKPAEALPILRRQVEARSKMGLEDDKETVKAELNLAAALWETGAKGETLEVFESLLPRYRKAFAAGSLDLALAIGGYGKALSETGQAEKAEPMLCEAYKILVDAPTADPARVEAARRRLARLYETLGDPDRAAKLRRANGGE